MSTWSAADEYPLADIPAVPLWSENYAFSCFDPQAGFAMIALLGRWIPATALWRELLLISLGGDQVLCVRQHGRAATSTLAAGALFQVEIVEAGHTLRLHYDGPASVHARDELLQHGLQSRPLQRLRLQLDFRSVAPVWMMDHAARGEAIAGSLHLEQVGIGEGWVEFDGQRRDIRQAFMNRDHSRGVRDLRPFRRHCWAQGWFADVDLSFHVYAIEVFGHDGPAMAKASVTQHGQRHEAEIVHIDMIEGLHARLQPYRLHLRSPLGEMRLVAARAAACLPIGVTHPWEVYAGTTPGHACMMTFEEPMHWDWDGRAGIGWSERAYNAQPFS